MPDSPPRLIVDDPQWPMPQPFGNPGTTAARRLRVWVAAGEVTAVVTERGEGMSVTNVAGQVHEVLLGQYRTLGQVRVLEHYPDDGDRRGEHFDEISVDDGLPHWRHVPTSQVTAWCGADVLEDPARAEDLVYHQRSQMEIGR
jgi:hypothetical protein